MTSDLQQKIEEIVGDAGDNLQLITDDQLHQCFALYQAASNTAFALLVVRCDNLERARRELARAVELPESVVARRAAEAAEILNADELPTVQHVAAQVAMITNEMQAVAKILDCRRIGAVH